MDEAKKEEKKDVATWKADFGWAQILSILSIIISLIVPVLGYTYFSPKLETQKSQLAELKEELKNRPELFVSEPQKSEGGKSQSLKFEITNVGKFPAKELQIIIITTAVDKFSKAIDKKEAIRNHLLVTPRIEYEPNYEGGMLPIIRLTLKRPLAPNESMSVTLLEIPTYIGIQNQYGDSINVFASGGI